MYTLEWDHIWARYERRWAVRDMCLGADAGQALCLVGPAGGGKTTLLQVAADTVQAAYGHVWVNGGVPRRGDVLWSEEPLRSALTVARSIERRAARAGLRGRVLDRRVKLTLRAWNLEPLREARLRTLSGTCFQRARLAMHWACPARVWLLDDPMAALEPDWCDALPGLLAEWRSREGGVTVTATPRPDEAMTADVAAILVDGRLAGSGAPERLCRSAGVEEIVVRTVDDAAASAALRANLRLEAERRPDGLHLRVRRAEAVLADVLDTVGSTLETVWVRRPSMRDAVAYYASLPPPVDAPTQPPVGSRSRVRGR